MKYRHSFHAGNFADVHKHVALCALLRAMQRKDRGFFYLDTHGGAGRYDLDSPDTHRGAEARHGATALLADTAQLQSEALRNYCAAILALRRQLDCATVYPGSPWLAAQLLRAQDRGLCCELLPAECRALERALGGLRRMRVVCADGYQQLRAALPPAERRCLVLIDPPYEHPVPELERALQAIQLILDHLSNAVVLVWYPIKDERALVPWLARVERSLATPASSLELWLYPRDSRVGLNGSGLLLVNPPYRFVPEAGIWQQELQRLLDPAGRGGSAVRALSSSGPAHDTGT
ncbi:MAG TPA: 23S rRNA (adenine(2030)-N(6))-methyltransferase RlmJ [Steroidobacteraceae bacterium]|jgi:23S rRNA (adenine2030-N6)-methyltransferase|nr:23S rRNA (adenine(2030)-N(6))-methyltransferase RlmJ [Steroidobacteraceae bacterium]